jgi:hypothetical protein
MRRAAAPAEPVAPTVHVIHPAAVYTMDDARRVLRLRQSTIRREVREGRLRIACRAGRRYLLGEWLLQWIREGELPRRPTATANGEERSA